MGAHKAMEHGEHAEHAAHTGSNRAALLVAILAALLAICEQRAKHAEIKLEESAIGATDAWNQYQAKSIRSTMAKDLADVVAATQFPGAAPDTETQRGMLVKRLHDDATRYEHGPDGKDEIAAHARELELERRGAFEQTHAYDNAAAALELGIVLSTASAITAAAPLLLLALTVGVIGLVLGILGFVAPSIATFG